MAEPVFICGAAKSGTNAVFESLRRTGGFMAPKLKEPGFFSPDIRGSRKVGTWEGYRALYPDGGGARPIDGSVSYLLSDVAADDILERFPRASFIVCLRRQADMARSFHGQLRRNATESIPDFREAWEAQSRRAAGHGIPATIAEPRLLQYRWVCSVGHHVERLLRTVPRAQVLFVEHERLAIDPGAVRRELADHLRVPATSIPPFERTNEARAWRVDPYPLLSRLPRPALEAVRSAKAALDRRGHPPTRLLRFALHPAAPVRSTEPGHHPGRPGGSWPGGGRPGAGWPGAGRPGDDFLRAVQDSFAADTERLRAATGLPLTRW